MKRVTYFKTANRGFPVSITGFIVHREILLVLCFIYIVGWFLGVLGVAFKMHEMRLLPSYTENNGL